MDLTRVFNLAMTVAQFLLTCPKLRLPKLLLKESKIAQLLPTASSYQTLLLFAANGSTLSKEKSAAG